MAVLSEAVNMYNCILEEVVGNCKVAVGTKLEEGMGEVYTC